MHGLLHRPDIFALLECRICWISVSTAISVSTGDRVTLEGVRAIGAGSGVGANTSMSWSSFRNRKVLSPEDQGSIVRTESLEGWVLPAALLDMSCNTAYNHA